MEALLRSGLAGLDLELDAGQVSQLLEFAAMLERWGGVYNLTARRDPKEIVSLHLLDSLAVVRPLLRVRGGAADRALDVGSGAGLPGVVLAIALPQLRVDCIDASAKKAAFIRQVAGVLRLGNVRALHGRVERLTDRYPLIMSRAFSSLKDFVEWSSGALAEGGAWMAMKGKFPSEEVADLPTGVEMFHVEQLSVPGVDAERCLVWMRRRPA